MRTWSHEVGSFLVERADRARAAGLERRPDRPRRRPRPGQDRRTVTRLAARPRTDLSRLGYPLLLSASNKTFLGVVLGLELADRREASLAAAALGVALGCRIVRVHDVAAHRQVCSVMAAIAAARSTA